ncbi:MAG: DUF4304 domain-containing protein [Alphaproteobacteria bacterium]|nr:DUF4304 domain-containing protein [Alphaproteobacteria bacterium]MBP7757870.1 DUF4304 domain-containing protein [Alphaproteobacteria bacterium]MBP7761197.1 DUF4304 domain-containing protein [Alphaproteobacteria bacterium]MBP7905882.1 DUF4304 domain-containing protein [Alphaproteobacteria bacterium]
MNSKAVNRSIKEKIRPYLKDCGFSHDTGRTFWRFSETRTEIVNFQSFNTALAESVGCTTYSFSVRLGYLNSVFPVFLRYLENKKTTKDGHALASESGCPFRCTLKRTVPQHIGTGLFRQKYRRTDIWYIDPEGQFIEPAMNDVREQLEKIALPWFENLQSDERMLDILLHRDEDMDSLWGFGRNPSPMRSYLTGYLALHMGRNALARTHLQAVLDSPAFEYEKTEIRKVIEKLAP